jgi:hypothetical protein
LPDVEIPVLNTIIPLTPAVAAELPVWIDKSPLLLEPDAVTIEITPPD